MAANNWRRQSNNIFLSIILMLIQISIEVHTERCLLDSSGENQSLPPPPEFPDFLSTFKETLLRIGLPRLPPDNEDLRQEESCAKSVNWTEFNSRLCGNDPFDLENFCISISTFHTTEESLEIITTDNWSRDSWSRDVTTGKTFSIPPSQTDGNRSFSTPRGEDDLNISLPSDQEEHSNDTDSIPADVLSSVRRPLLPVFTSGVTDVTRQYSDDGQWSVNSSTTAAAEALPHNGSVSMAIGLGCCLTILLILIIVLVIVGFQTRNREFRRMLNPLLKVMYRQTSESVPFNASSPSQPSTPLEEYQPSGSSNNNNAIESQWKSVKTSVDLQI